MLTNLHIRNFKSLRDVTIAPGLVTVLIGENGCGKSNFLEAIAMAGAGIGEKLDNEFLVSRGIRVTEPPFMRSAFTPQDEPISVDLCYGADRASLRLNHDNTGPDFGWTNLKLRDDEDLPGRPSLTTQVNEQGKLSVRVWDGAGLARELELTDMEEVGRLLEELWNHRKDYGERLRPLTHYVIYSPENTALRTFEVEGQIQPLGIKGEGLFKLLKSLSGDAERIAEIKENLRLIDWFADFKLPTVLAPYERHLEIRDRYIGAADGGEAGYFDQRSANEGFLFLLFYFTLFISPDTPKLFAIDNIDASLNPKLCTEVMRRLTALAQKHGKQVLITTHNPAVLDGLNLHDDEQRLFTVRRSSTGETKLRRVSAPKSLAGEAPVKLSEAFSRGLLGGLPQNF
ncbi:MAG: AAA family ATPase [Nannocystis sp.]|nr:AAA family ATPase [Nannocystis sp.]MBA3546529.1 AAA family ATPase [Nannocystis sp.]